MTDQNIVTDGGHSFSASWGDFDADGDLDLFIANGISTSLDFLYVNNGDGTFSRVLESPVVTTMNNSTSGRWVDYDADGDLDLLVAGLYGPVIQFRNDGSTGFSRVFDGVIANLETQSRKIGPADYDNDGDLDLLITQRRGRNNLLFRNIGGGVFEQVLEGAIVNDGGDSTCVEWADIDDDGDLDVFICNSGENNFLYRNEGSGQFERVFVGPISWGGSRTGSGSWGDYDNDGDLDLYIANVNDENNVMYRNEGQWTFTKITDGIHVNDGGESNAANAVDIDNDGDLDLFVANVGGRNNLYLNDGKGSFSKILEGRLVETDRVSASASWGDFDRDGDLDVLVANLTNNDRLHGDNQLFENNGSENHWLHIRLAGTSSNPSGFGARIRLQATISGNTVNQIRELTAGVGNGTSGLELAFGLGDASIADSIIVRWPSRIVQTISNVSANQLLTITEPRVDLEHERVRFARPGSPISILADITDEPGLLRWVTVFYRPVGTSEFTGIEAFAIRSERFLAELPASTVDLEYYIVADFGSFFQSGGSADHPYRVFILRNEPRISSVEDVPHDSGNQVSIVWFASLLDSNISEMPFYSVWRSVPGVGSSKEMTATFGEASSSSSSLLVHHGNSTWEWLSNQPALKLDSYAYTARTLYDRSEMTDGIHKYIVVAHTNDPDRFYVSESASGYSWSSNSSFGIPAETFIDLPDVAELHGNYPNPFNPSTTISYSLHQFDYVTLTVYDLLGRRIRQLVSEMQTAGQHRVSFDAQNLSSGIYVYALQAGSFVDQRRFVLMK